MTFIIEYAKISPVDLRNLVKKRVPNALCIVNNIDKDFFEFCVGWWMPTNPREKIEVKKVLAPYV